MLNIYNNKEAFLRLKPYIGFNLIILFILIVIIITIFASQKYTYDNYLTKGTIICDQKCLINTIIPTDIEIAKIEIDNKAISYEIIDRKLIVDNEKYISYYEINLETPLITSDEKIVTINILYNKQRIIEKIKSKMF